MLTIDLTHAQATGLLALLEHAEQRAVDHLELDPRRLVAMRRGVERFRRALDGVKTIEDFDPLLEDLGRTLDGLHDPATVTRCLDRLRDLTAAVRIAAGVERFRRTAARRGQEAYTRWADGVLGRFAAGDPRWIDAAITLFDDLTAAPDDHPDPTARPPDGAPAGRRGRCHPARQRSHRSATRTQPD